MQDIHSLPFSESSVQTCEGCISHTSLSCVITHLTPQDGLHGKQLVGYKSGLSVNHYLCVLDADLTTTNSRPQTSCFQSLTLRRLELIWLFDGCKPETELVGKVVACSTRSITFNEWSGSEVFKTWSWTCKWLPTSLSTSCSML